MIPVYRDIPLTIKVIEKFKTAYVDLIFLVIDDPKEAEVETIRRAIKKVTIPVLVVVNEKRKGIGCAIRKGIDYGIANKFDIIVVLAGNNKDDPDQIPRMLAPILDYGFDYVQGSRFLPGGKKVNNPFMRGVFSRLYPFIWGLLTNVRCTDVTNGFRAYKLKLFENSKINIWQSWLDSYELEYYIHYKVLTLGYRVQEVPVSKVYPTNLKCGYSQISPFRDWWRIVRPLIYLKLGARN